MQVCEWCKDACCDTKFVEFTDGGDTYMFCSDGCLNKYKMNIFCQETQEHMKKARQERAAEAGGGGDTRTASNILITPELWVEDARPTRAAGNKLHDVTVKQEDQGYRSRHQGKGSSAGLMEGAKYRQRTLSHSPGSDYSHNTSSLMRVVALKAKAELEHPKTTRVSNNRPPRMTDREKIKQIRMRDKLPLHTPLRETYRGHSHTDLYNVMSRHSSSPPTLTSSFSATNPVFSSSTMSAAAPTMSHMAPPLSPGQLISALTASHRLRPLPSQSMSPDVERRRDNTDSCSSQSTSPRLPSSEPGAHPGTTPAPPLYPPPNPFSHILPSYFNLANGPLGFPAHAHPGLAHLSALSGMLPHPPPPPPPLLPTSMANGILPPNTLMMPYPFMIPLPIPVPIPIPVPRSMVDACMKQSQDTRRNDTANTDTKENIVPDAKVCRNKACASLNNPTHDSIKCSCCTASQRKDTADVSTVQTDKRRYYLESKKPGENNEHDNRAIDLSTNDSARYRPGNASPPPGNSTSPTASSPLVIQPTSILDPSRDASPSVVMPPAFPPALNAMLSYTNSRYSSRRSLILDAPSSRAGPDPARSPSPGAGDKRPYNTASVRDILYGKRKCARPRIKTK